MRTVQAQQEISQSESNEAWRETKTAFKNFITEVNKHNAVVANYKDNEQDAHVAIELNSLYIPISYIEEVEIVSDKLSPSKRIIARRGVRFAKQYIRSSEAAAEMLNRSPPPDFALIAGMIAIQATTLGKFAAAELGNDENHSESSKA